MLVISCVISVYLFCSLSFFYTSMLVSFVKFLCIFLGQLQPFTCFLHCTFFLQSSCIESQSLLQIVTFQVSLPKVVLGAVLYFRS